MLRRVFPRVYINLKKKSADASTFKLSRIGVNCVKKWPFFMLLMRKLYARSYVASTQRRRVLTHKRMDLKWSGVKNDVLFDGVVNLSLIKPRQFTHGRAAGDEITRLWD